MRVWLRRTSLQLARGGWIGPLMDDQTDEEDKTILSHPQTTIPTFLPNALDSKVELRMIYNLPIHDLDGIGLDLGISQNTLSVIQKNNCGDETSRKREILGQWLRQDIKASYRKLAEVLNKHDPPEVHSIEKLAKNLAEFGHLLDPEDGSDLLAAVRSAASQWRDIGRHLGIKLPELNDMIFMNNTPVDYLEEMMEQWLNFTMPLRSYTYTEDLVEALRAAKLEKLAQTLEDNESCWVSKAQHCTLIFHFYILSVEAGMGHMLDPEDVDSLFGIVKGAKAKWRDIGRELGFTLKEMDEIVQKKGISQDQDYFQELLDLWLNWAPPEKPFPCTEDLLDALRHIGQHRLALKLENTESIMGMKTLVTRGLQLNSSLTIVSGHIDESVILQFRFTNICHALYYCSKQTAYSTRE
eukprot:Em0002g1556a